MNNRALIVIMMLILLTACGGSITLKWNRQDVKIQQPKGLVLNVYVENSGSMNGYVCDGSEFKDAIYDYVSKLSSCSKQTNLNFINTQIVPSGHDLHNFIWNLNPQNIGKDGGSHANSQISNMLAAILKQINKNTVSVFISDCILDVPQGESTGFFHLAQTDIGNAIRSRLVGDNDFAVEIIQLESKFSGNYYGTDGVTKLSGQKRPYYIWVMGDKQNLAWLNSQIRLSTIPHGYKHCVAFSSPSKVSFDIFNQFSKTDVKKASQGRKLSIKTKVDGGYKVLVKCNLYPALIDQLTLKDGSAIKTNDTKVALVKAFETGDEHWPHQLELSIGSNFKKGQMLTITNTVPAWVSHSNDDSGKDITKHLDKTSGIKYIIQGVADAYSGYKDKGCIKFTIQ